MPPDLLCALLTHSAFLLWQKKNKKAPNRISAKCSPVGAETHLIWRNKAVKAAAMDELMNHSSFHKLQWKCRGNAATTSDVLSAHVLLSSELRFTFKAAKPKPEPTLETAGIVFFNSTVTITGDSSAADKAGLYILSHTHTMLRTVRAQ